LTAPPPVARDVFGDRLELATRFAELLVTEAVVRGLIGPREEPRIWDRHLLNCAVIAELIPADAHVIDVGSGAGLPGIVLAIVRPDLTVDLVEPLARRTAFLDLAVDDLGLDQTTVVRARAEEADLPLADVVTARAVAPLDRLAGWCLPLAVVGGRLLAMKGESAAAEIEEHAASVRRIGGSVPVVRVCGAGVVEPPATVIEVVREGTGIPAGAKRGGKRGRRASGWG
jgi:16S rRNA (guanine527-N7)-methyltransferase